MQGTQTYKFAGRIYHDYLLGTLVRIRYRSINLRKRLSGQNPVKTVLFYPDKPGYADVLYKVCNSMGYTMTSASDSQPDLVIAYEDVTERAPSRTLTELAASHFVLNRRCHDIGKVNVERAFQEVFGYGTFVDPATHQGQCVVKSNENGSHDGEIIECPTQSEREGAVFQRLINNVVGDEALDIRVPIVGQEIPFVYLKYRKLRSRFSNLNARVSMDSAAAVFTSDEIKAIHGFVEELGLDYGELDVLRDRDDGRIYIVDVNNTPFGPPNHLPKADGRRAIGILSEAFDRQFMTDTNKARDAR
ncbi:hypothetical protein [Mycobacterium sp. SMC-4]|uniref:hypothetical protein n=1 Tax=Mycobacterium sp. SMC-4 TaxID=2857059 RepID=UPI003CFCFAC8